MSASTTRRLAALLWGVCLALAAGTLVLLVLGAGEHTKADGSTFDGSGGLSFVAASMAFATVGAMIAARVPENSIGWIFCATGVGLGVADFGSQYAEQMLFISSDPLPGGRAGAVFQQLGFAPSFGLLSLALLLFPDGRSPSGRWRGVLWLALAGIALSVVGIAFRPGPLVEPFDDVSNPFGIPGLLGLMDTFLGLGFVFTLASVVLAALGMRARLRRSRGLEREQLKWLVLAAAVTGLAVVGTLVLYFAAGIDVGGVWVLGFGFSVFPLAAGAAILRYRIYDIDVVINRTLVYAALTATLALAYLGSVLLLQLALSGVTEGSGLAVAASTLAVAALFRPARARIQEAVDRRFYRSKYDAARTLTRFGSQLRDEVDLDALGGTLRRVVTETMQPAHVSLWLRAPEARR
jgi:hypothetical protein